MKTILAIISLSLCSCAEYDFAGVFETPYGQISYQTPPPVVEPEK